MGELTSDENDKYSLADDVHGKRAEGNLKRLQIAVDKANEMGKKESRKAMKKTLIFRDNPKEAMKAQEVLGGRHCCGM